jgi:hypothetical protein
MHADVVGGAHRAIVVSFTLTSSSYATMALREVLRGATDPARQAVSNVTGQEGDGDAIACADAP